jgi:ferritin-like metal-binding protein YciE
MSATALQQKVIGYLQDTHAMERQVYHMLNGLIATSHDPEVLERLKVHRHETERQARLIRDRLAALGSGPALREDVPAMMTAWMKGFYDMIRADKPGKNARDAYVTEHMEIAAYNLLQRLAERAGDLETVRLARALAEEERQMAQWIDNHWDKFIDLTLESDRLQPYWAAAAAGPGGPPHAADGGLLGGATLATVGLAVGLGACGYVLLQLMRPGSQHPTRPDYNAGPAWGPAHNRADIPTYAGM